LSAICQSKHIGQARARWMGVATSVTPVVNGWPSKKYQPTI